MELAMLELNGEDIPMDVDFGAGAPFDSGPVETADMNEPVFPSTPRKRKAGHLRAVRNIVS
jgi:hypothetical protein